MNGIIRFEDEICFRLFSNWSRFFSHSEVFDLNRYNTVGWIEIYFETIVNIALSSYSFQEISIGKL